MKLSVVLPTHNPAAARLARTLRGLRSQTLPAAQWETLVVDNASAAAVVLPPESAPANLRVLMEPTLGLTHARRRGLAESRGEIIVLVDDDNVLAPDYLAQVVALFTALPTIGALGGRSVPEFEQAPADWWLPEFDGLLACRDLGPAPLISTGLLNPATGRDEYPVCAPIGAGMALRRAAAQVWLDAPDRGLTDRRGGELTSGGDNDIVLTLLGAGWAVGYFPELALTHLIPAGRVQPDYVGRLKRGIAKSWVQVLHKHGANPWPPVAPWTVPLRQLKAWFTYRAWAGPAAYVRWQGACGQFEGLATLPRNSA